jgi:hypothetical protein
VAFDVTQTNFHADSAPAVQRMIRQLAPSQNYLVTNEIRLGENFPTFSQKGFTLLLAK